MAAYPSYQRESPARAHRSRGRPRSAAVAPKAVNAMLGDVAPSAVSFDSAIVNHLVDLVADRVASAVAERLRGHDTDEDECSTRATRPSTSASIETHFGSSQRSGRSLQSRTGRHASSSSGGRTSTHGGAAVEGCGIWRRHSRQLREVRIMEANKKVPRRVRVERNIYRRASGVYEVGFKDGGGKQRWRTVEGGITAARAVRDELLARRARGERIAPDVRLRFGDAAARWLAGPVPDLRPATQACYRNALEQHLLPRFGARRMDAIQPDDLAGLVRELRGNGLSESTIVIVIGVANRVYRYAARRLPWLGTNPVSVMLPSERPKPSQGARRRVFNLGELEQTIAAAGQPFRTLFTLAALTGARLSELLALTWADVRIDGIDDAEVEFAQQVDRHGNLRPTKTDGSARTVPIPHELALILASHHSRSRFVGPQDFVFATRSGRPLGQRNVLRALRRAQMNATDKHGNPSFPGLHERDEDDRPIPVRHGAVPSMHSFRHTVASRALLAGESIDEVAFLLGHRDANVTRAVYLRELTDARRRSMRRSRMLAEYGDLLRGTSSRGDR